MVTIKQIAEISGVSRGTVDRVLNDRGRVAPEKEALVRRVAEQLGYRPNLAGRALAARKKSFVIGVLLTAEGNPFFDYVIQGVRRAEKELADYGVTVVLKSIKGYEVQRQLEAIRDLAGQVSALVLNPYNDPAVTEEIQAMTEKGIPVLTVNTDIENCSRACYIGNDYYQSGRLACGLLGLLAGGRANLGILTGSSIVLGHSQRIAGFREVMRQRYPEMHFLDMGETQDDDVIAFEATKRMLEDHPEIDALFVVAGGVYGVCRAVLSLGRQGAVKVVSSDVIPKTEELMHQGLIQATVSQRPVEQGYQAVQLAYSCLVSGRPPEQDNYIVGNEIKILENLSC